MATLYSIREGELAISDGATGAIVWEGRLDECSVTKVFPLPEGDAIALLDYMCVQHRLRPFPNLLRIRPDGAIAWRAELPQLDDAYVSAAWADEVLSAGTWKGWHVRLDPDSGQIREKTFTK